MSPFDERDVGASCKSDSPVSTGTSCDMQKIDVAKSAAVTLAVSTSFPKYPSVVLLCALIDLYPPSFHSVVVVHVRTYDLQNVDDADR